MSDAVGPLRPIVSNALPDAAAAFVTGIIGDRPSQYAKTPPLWNAVYRALGWDAVSLPFDLEEEKNLAPFLEAARRTPALGGFSVTVPFKIAIVPLLDEIDPLARAIGAVNTVVRRADGTLAGYNTDGQGAIDSLTLALPGMGEPFMSSLDGRQVLMVGAGGAARAVAFFLAERIGPKGSIRIVNRDGGKARDLAQALAASGASAEAGGEDLLVDWARETDLLVNSSVKGQAGWRRAASGAAFMLEPYSSLGPASPAQIAPERALDAAASREWFVASREDIDRNAAESRRTAASLPVRTACFDLIYAPLETRFLADARWSGHATLNGKWMNIAQAADGFARKVCVDALRRSGMNEDAGYRRAFEVMTSVW